ADAVAANTAIFTQFRASRQFGPYSGLDQRQNSRRNLVIENISLEAVHKELLTRYRVTRLEDSQQFGAMLRLVQLHLIDDPDDTCSVFLMAEGSRRRRSYVNDRIGQLFQGRLPTGAGPLVYPGDREVRAANGITVQMGYLDLVHPNDAVDENIPYLAV